MSPFLLLYLGSTHWAVDGFVELQIHLSCLDGLLKPRLRSFHQVTRVSHGPTFCASGRTWRRWLHQLSTLVLFAMLCSQFLWLDFKENITSAPITEQLIWIVEIVFVFVIFGYLLIPFAMLHVAYQFKVMIWPRDAKNNPVVAIDSRFLLMFLFHGRSEKKRDFTVVLLSMFCVKRFTFSSFSQM